MEALLKLSGLLNEEDGDRTDLGTLEKRLADKTLNQSNGGTPSKSPGGKDFTPQTSASSDSRHETPQRERRTSLKSTAASPETGKQGEEEVEALSDLMCSLVTNNQGESRYIGKFTHEDPHHCVPSLP